MLDILDPQYIISEIVGGLFFASILAFLLIIYICVKLKFNFQITAMILVFTLSTIGFIAYNNLFIAVLIIVGIFSGIIFYSLLNKG